jgi:hypothetical protein
MATHYVARELAAIAHDVKQVPPALQSRFGRDTRMTFECSCCGRGRAATDDALCSFVPAKTNEQLDLQALHR